MDPIVQMEEICKDYQQGDLIVHALKEVTLSLLKGDFAAMAGPSGSGKSTMLNIIGGMLKPTSGKVRIDGKEITVILVNILKNNFSHNKPVSIF